MVPVTIDTGKPMPRTARLIIPVGLVAGALLSCGLPPRGDSGPSGLVGATLQRPEGHPDGAGLDSLSLPGTAELRKGALWIEARDGSQALVVTVSDFPRREGVFQLATPESYGAWGRVDASCAGVGPDAASPCALTHTSRANFGLLTVTRHRPDRIAGTFRFRALHRSQPETAFNVTDGSFDLALRAAP